MKILVVEDDPKTASFILKGLKEAGYTVEHAQDGEEGVRRMTAAVPDVVVADLMLPKMDGLAMIAEMARRKLKPPTIILSARASLDDRIKGLQTGADDYLVKPFAFTELLARIQALLRRGTTSVEPTRLVVDDLVLDLLSREARRQGRLIDLQPREFSLLEYLMRNTGRVVSKTMIMEHVWDYNFDPLTNVVEVRISHLRDKVDRPFERRLIHTIRGAGYVLRAEK